MSNSSNYTHNVKVLSDQFSILKQCYNNQEGLKLLLSQDNNSKSSRCSDRKIYVGDIALLDESPVNITQICSNTFKPASNEDEIAIDGQKTRKPRTVVNEKWSTEEDSRLAKAVKEHGAKNWKNIAKIVGGSRTDVQCLHRWRKVISPELVKGPWTSSEDKIIIEEVEKVNSLANVKWSEIAQRLHGRIGKQCRERYLNYLDASIKRTEWTEEEDRILFEIQRVIGNRWCEIAKVLPGRSENNVKNRYNSKIRNVYMTKYPNQMIPASIIIEQQIEDPLHNSKKRRILCPAVKNLLKYLDLSKEYFENLNNFTNMKNGKDGNNNFSLSIQPSSSSSSSSSSPSLILPISDMQMKQEQSLEHPLKRSFKEIENDCKTTPVDNSDDDDDANKYKKPKLDSIINNEIYNNNNNNLDYTLNNQFRYNDEEENDKIKLSKLSSPQPHQPQQHNQYQLRRKRRVNNKGGEKGEIIITTPEEGEQQQQQQQQQQRKRGRERISIVNNDTNNNINILPHTNYTDDSMLLSGIVDEEEAYKNFVETIPDNKLRNFNNNSNTNNINNNNNNNTNSLVKCNNCILNNNFSDCSAVEDELNSSCLDCFQ